jgi:hypothetical protein
LSSDSQSEDRNDNCDQFDCSSHGISSTHRSRGAIINFRDCTQASLLCCCIDALYRSLEFRYGRDLLRRKV